MVDKLPSEFLGCLNPCSSRWPNLSDSPIKFETGTVIQKLFLNEMGECEECKSKFTILRRKKYCNTCGLTYCNSCLTRSQVRLRQCRKCVILSQWPINRDEISSLRVRDLRHYLNTCKIRTDTFKEKQDLVELVIVQLRRNHENDDRRHPTNSAAEPNSSSRNNLTTTTTRDDGIRVRPFAQQSPEREVPFAIPQDDNESGGIRVFASENERELSPDVSNVSDPVVNANLSDDSSSFSGWSVIPSDEVVESASSDSISASSPNIDTLNNVSEDTTNEVNLSEQNNVSETREPGQVHVQDGANISQADDLVTPEAASNSVNVKQTLASEVVKLSSIVDEESIKDLSVRQCKEILILHRVDFSGVWEKHELVNKVKMLWRDYKQRETEQKNLTEDQLCKICMDAAIDCVLLECGHVVSCTECGKQMAECPICRQNVLRVVKTFRA